MMVIKIPQNKVADLAEHIEKGIKYIGKAMQCVSELQEQGGEMGERSYGYYNAYGNRGGYGNRYGYGNRWDDDDDDEMDMGERRGVPGTGRYSRLRRY